jgi:crotonobetainyl-CoA:carnitine CoA-transferase CaiB-like acyl-CoA transferase
VLELGQVISAPYAGLMLADLGAEVTKVEVPGTGDSARDPSVTPLGDVSATFVTFNRNKRSIALDLADEAEYALFGELVAGADVVLTNMVPRVATKLRVDPATLRALNPALVHCSILGFRSEDERSSEPTYDLTHQALVGLMLMEGRPGDPPLRVCVPIADLLTAHFAVQAVLAALVARDRDGVGDAIEVPMYDAMVSLLTYTATLYLNAGQPARRMGSEHEYVVPWQAVEARDGALVVATRSAKFWERLCTAVGREDWLDDPRFATNEARLAHRDLMREVLDEVFRTRTVAAWLDILQGVGVPAAPVRTVAEALDAAPSEVPGLVHEVDCDGRTLRLVGSPLRFSRLEVACPEPPPALDELGATLREGRRP